MSTNPKMPAKSLATFDKNLAEVSIRGQWQYDEMLERLIDGPKTTALPMLWKWDVVQRKLMEACDVMEESFTARRNLSFINPGLERGGTSHTILAGMQAVKPGEVAWAHRHPISALRFVMDGDPNLFTVVNGEVLPMETHDLVLTPAWTWHDHHNEGKSLGVWLDVLDVPLMLSLGQMAYQPLGNTTQPMRSERHEYSSERTGIVRPMWEKPVGGALPRRYPWADVKRQLDLFCEGGPASPYDDVILEYVDPTTGGSTLPTLRCCVQRLRAGFVGQQHRRTASTVYYVIEGEGSTRIGDTELHWGPRDVFVVPTWMWHEHRSLGQGATLFSVSDAPVMEAAQLYREEPESQVGRHPSPPPPLHGHVKSGAAPFAGRKE
ncbi:MAG: cupin domain-containing protein [Hydrogenophaga sp.]|nr:cupin domain-containing protein [Hydrogenophaga sp.]